MLLMIYIFLFICFFCLILVINYLLVERFIRVFKEGEVDYIFVDMYFFVKCKDFFNGFWFEIVVLYKVEISYGIFFWGDVLNFVFVLEEMIVYDNV